MSRTLRTWARRLVFGAVFAYLFAALMLATLQRGLIFPAPPPRAVPPSSGTLVEGRSAGGRRVVALWSPLREGAPTVAYFHGNGMQLADSAELVPALHALGCNAFCVEYPGYGPLAGDTPGEEALIDVAAGAMALLRARHGVSPSRTVLLGQSLGTGVASALAARGAGARLALMSPFRSITEVARGIFPWLPVGLLLRHRFDTEALAPQVVVPTLILHGTRDEVIPFAHGERLARVFPRATLARVEGGHHNDLWSDHSPRVMSALRGFIAPGE